MNNTVEHQELCDEIMLELGTHERIRIWPRRVGVATPIGTNRATAYGIKGEADLQGIVAPSGRMFGIEVKTGTGRRSPSQKKWAEMIVRFGGAYCEAHSLEDAIRFKQELLK